MVSLSSGSAVRLGRDVNSSQFVTLEQEQRLGGMSFIGLSGFGKTTLLINLLLQDVEQGIGVCFFDVHGDAINDILARLPAYRVIDGVKRPIEEDVIFLNLLDIAYPFGMNFYECPDPNDPRQRSLTVNYLRDVIAKYFTKEGDLTATPRIAQILRNTTLTMIDNPGMTLAEFPLLLEHEEARTRLTKQVNNSIVKLFWERYERMKPSERQTLYESTANKIEEFLTDNITLNIFGQSKTTINFREIMDNKPGKILLIRLDRNLEQLTSLVGSVIISQIAKAAFSREDIPYEDRVQFNLYADEYERFQTPTFAALIAEVRKYKIAPLIAFQWLSQLDVDNRNAAKSAANIIVSRVNNDDAQEFAPEFAKKPPPAEPRREPIQVITQEPVEYLLRYGCPHDHYDRMKTFLEDYLSKIAIHIESMDQGINLTTIYPDGEMFEDEHKYTASRHRLKEGLQKINMFFVQKMTEQKAKISSLSEGDKQILDEKEIIYEICDALRAFIGFAPEQALRRVENILRSRYQDPFEHEWYEIPLSERTKWAYLIYWKKGMFWLDDLSKVFDKFKSHGMSKEEDKAFRQSLGAEYMYDYQDYLTSEDDYNRKELIAERYEYARSQLKSYLVSTKSPTEIHAILLQRARTEVHAILQFSSALSFAAGVLGRYPIMVDSPQFKDVPGIQRTFADMVNEMALELPNLPHYTAYCKLISGKYTIRIDDKKAPDAQSVVVARTQKIIEQTRKLYCKKRTDVEKEIADRQAELTKPLKPQKKAKQDEDEE